MSSLLLGCGPWRPGRPHMHATIAHFYSIFSLPVSGDAMAALLLGWCHRRPGRLQEAVVAAVAALQAVLKVTNEAAGPAAHSADRTAEVRIRVLVQMLSENSC